MALEKQLQWHGAWCLADTPASPLFGRDVVGQCGSNVVGSAEGAIGLPPKGTIDSKAPEQREAPHRRALQQRKRSLLCEHAHVR